MAGVADLTAGVCTAGARPRPSRLEPTANRHWHRRARLDDLILISHSTRKYDDALLAQDLVLSEPGWRRYEVTIRRRNCESKH
jgi:hypothetical protein